MSNLQQEFDTHKSELDQWIKSIGLIDHQPSSEELDNILSYDREDIRSRSSIDLSEDCIILAQYAFFMQQKANECSTFLKWVNQVRKRISNNDQPKLVKWERNISLRLDRISYLARRIEMISQAISNLVRARYNDGRNE